jgi:hypothetical protein
MSSITNSYDPDAKRPRAEVESVFIYRPENDWTYSHHQSVTYYNKRFYAIWSNGREHEDDVGQRVLIASSDDFHTWTEPVPLVDSTPGEHSELVLTAAGFHQHGDTLSAYMGRYEYRSDRLEHRKRKSGDFGHQRTGLWSVSTLDGTSWRPPQDVGIPIVPNHGPQRTRSGRLIISGNISFPYTDDPSGLSGWSMTGIYPEKMDPLYDDSEAFWIVRDLQQWPVGLCEGSFYQTDDGILHMLLRSGTPYLWVTESTDDGRSWSDPTETKFTDNGTKFHFGRLSDGRFFYVGCPDPEPKGARRPLVLSVSGDGVRFDSHRILGDDEYQMNREGLHKGGQYGYPHTMVHDGSLYIIVSRRKEAVQILRTKLP